MKKIWYNGKEGKNVFWICWELDYTENYLLYSTVECASVIVMFIVSTCSWEVSVAVCLFSVHSKQSVD